MCKEPNLDDVNSREYECSFYLQMKMEPNLSEIDSGNVKVSSLFFLLPEGELSEILPMVKLLQSFESKNPPSLVGISNNFNDQYEQLLLMMPETETVKHNNHEASSPVTTYHCLLCYVNCQRFSMPTLPLFLTSCSNPSPLIHIV
ncbi:hypothetical protein VNO77_05945 [Canavalia gladiata]|uniref:Uncharacterized protein n=1 Tax=Canavalia gladiata TaxID=3824 RepID=A0AAN9N4G9_CANGL